MNRQVRDILQIGRDKSIKFIKTHSENEFLEEVCRIRDAANTECEKINQVRCKSVINYYIISTVIITNLNLISACIEVHFKKENAKKQEEEDASYVKVLSIVLLGLIPLFRFFLLIGGIANMVAEIKKYIMGSEQ